MTDDDGKAPAPAPSRPLARWALATLAMDAVLLATLWRLPRPIESEPAGAPRGAVAKAIVTRGHAVFLLGHTGSQRLVIVSATGPARVADFAWSGDGDVRCAMLSQAEPSARCPEPAERAMRDGLEFVVWRVGAMRWEPAITRVQSSTGDASGREREVRATVDGLSVQARLGYRVERPWVQVEDRRERVERDMRVERAALVRGAQNEPLFMATPDGGRWAIDRRVAQRRRGLFSTLAGELGELSLMAAGAWLLAQVTALAAARTTEGSSVFWRRFLRWSAMLGTFVTGALALGAMRLAGAS
jgi:hypothetical protein